MIESLKRAILDLKMCKRYFKRSLLDAEIITQELQIGQKVVEDAVNRVKREDDEKKDGRVDKEVVEENDKEEDEKREGDFF